jgi:hypothetical protein
LCPSCRQNAPLVYRGLSAFCTACGAPRVPLANASVNLAGQPSKVGGTVARVFGWMVLAGGWIVASLLALLIGVVLEAGATALWVAGPIALLSSLIAYFILRGGKALQKSGDDEELAMKTHAIFALANTRGGILSAVDVAQALSVSVEAGDALLTKLAKEQHELVSVDIDDQGNVLYRFRTAAPRMAPNAVPAHVRIAPPPVRVDAREPLPLEDAYEEASARSRGGVPRDTDSRWSSRHKAR